MHIYRCRHRNLVDLVGYCSSPPILVYEYLEGGSLYDRMFKSVCMYVCMYVCITYTYVTGFVKIVPIGTTIEIQFMA